MSTPRKLLFALWALLTLVSTPAFAANQKPTDIPAGSSTTPIAATYATGTTLNRNGPTGTGSTHDTPPYYAFLPTEVPTPNRSNWTTITDGTLSYTTCTSIAVSCEAKVRVHLNDHHVLYDDMLRNFGELGTSHCHDFVGNDAATGRSTYFSLRKYSESHSTGGRLNATSYWFPCALITNPFGDGKNYAVRIDVVGIYYKADNSVSPWLVAPPPTFGYVFGTNMDDPQNTTRRREVVVANVASAAAGVPNRYSYAGDGYAAADSLNSTGVGCMADVDGSGSLVQLSGAKTATGAQYVPYLNSIDGQTEADPFLGYCEINPTSHAKPTIIIEIQGADCWNGRSGWVPGAYDHVRIAINDSQLNGGRVQRACPDTWYHFPQLEEKVQYTSNGWADHKRWRLASDDAMEAKLNSLPTCTTDATGAYANAPCAVRSGPLWNATLGRFKVPNFASFHGDWKMGWDGVTWKLLMANCMGVTGLHNGDGNLASTVGALMDTNPATCEPGVIVPNGTNTTFMISGTPPLVDPQGAHHNPIIDESNGRLDSSVPGNMFRVRTHAPSGMASGKMCMNTTPC